MNFANSQPRRQFIKQFAIGTVVSTLAGKTTVSRVLAADDEDTSGVLSIKVSDWPVLAATNGSIRINFSPIAGNGQPGRWYPVILTRGTVPGTTFYPLKGQCTHEQCVVTWFGWGGNNFISCQCHGSTYTRTGAVRTSPATAPLSSYPYTFDGSVVRITIPDLYHKVDVLPVPNSSRVRIDFNASRNGRHKLLYRNALDAAWTSIPFSLTPGGAADQTTYLYESFDYVNDPDAKPASLYVDFAGDRGYFAIELQYEVEHS